MVSSIQKKIIWAVWLIIFPAGLWLTYQMYPPQIEGNHIDILLFLCLALLVAATPIVVNSSLIILSQWVSFATFFTFGLFIELLMAQLTIAVLFIRIQLSREQLFRIPLNSIMFFLVSLLSGGIFYYIVDCSGARFYDGWPSPWLYVIYPVLSYFLHHLFIALFNLIFLQRKSKVFGIDFVWETITTLLSLPLGLVLYILYMEVGLIACIFVAIPFTSFTIILHLYYSSKNINELLQKATEIGHQLAERLNVDEVLDLFIQKLTQMFPVDYAYIHDVVDDKELQVIRRVEKGEKKSLNMKPLKKSEGISGKVWEQKKSLLFSSKKEWEHISKGYMPENVESVLSVSVVRNSQVTGVLFLASTQKRSFKKLQLMIVDILCSHFAIAVENARNYEATKALSERCTLTNLYNYRYFENILAREFMCLEDQHQESLSLIILDIDHFKSINDTYGHQSGNEILRQLATKLVSVIDQNSTVARFGGEEFVILLPNIEKPEALMTAELVRKLIANNQFILDQHIGQDGQRQYVHITVSIGVATAPYDADNPLTLIRHADRALYVGAKRAGRNRVAEYKK